MIEARTADAVRSAEEPLLAAERSFAGGLMDTAAGALADAVADLLARRGTPVAEAALVALVGSGSNGGDALHALARLGARGARCTAVVTSGSVHEGGLTAFTEAGGRVLGLVEDAPGEPVWAGDALAEVSTADVVLDGLLGIGGRGGLRGAARELVELVTGLDTRLGRVREAARPDVVAVDLPSGTGVDDGTVPGPVLAADLTVTFGAVKPSLLLPPAAHLAGRVQLVDLGLVPVLVEQGAASPVRRLETSDVADRWPVPGPTSHKYSRVVGVVAGTAAYPGAAVLTVAGAQGAGCGMVRYVGPERVRDLVVGAHPEVVAGGSTDVHVQAWVVGPGLDPDDAEQAERAREVLADASGLPVVVDAGALGLLPERVGPRVVLTPHAGELARLLTDRGEHVTREEVEAEPLRRAQEAHRLTGATVLLKGAVTVVVGPAGAWAQADAPPWLATAGAGDVLAGVLGAVLAGGVDQADRADPDDPGGVAQLAALAALVHGRAGHRANPGGPVTAGDVARALPTTIAALLRGETA